MQELYTLSGEVKAAIVGTGAIAHEHAAGLQAQGGRVRLVAAVDLDPGRLGDFCESRGVRSAYTDLDLMLAAERPQLVHICTPPATHYELIVRCLGAGSWVLCEKPLCGSLAELDRIGEVERETGAYCSCVFQWRFGSGAQHLRGLIREGALGRPLVGICQTTWHRDRAYYTAPWRGRWATELGGPTMGHGIHAMDLFLWLLGDWLQVSSMAGTLDREIEVEDVSVATIRFESGALGGIVNSVLSPREQTYLRLDFQTGTVEMNGLYGYTNDNWSYSAPPQAAAPTALARGPSTDTPSSHGAQIKALLNSMERGERPLVSGEESRRTLEFVTSLYKAAATGERVARGSIAPGDPFYEHVAGTLASAKRAGPRQSEQAS
jgi:predicted dehydrogenase